MSIIVPNNAELDILTVILTPAHTIKLYGNAITPGPTNLAATFTEIVGGGYAGKPLTFANWVLVAGAPTWATYPLQTWTFTGVINAPGTIYGYFVTRNSDGKLIWAEKFPTGFFPFTPINGSTVKITSRFYVNSVY